MDNDLGFGPCLSIEEYEKKIHDLYSQLPPEPSREEDKSVRRQELELTIDHRLGRNFPQERREALWTIQQQVERKRLLLLGRYLLKRIFPSSISKGAQRLANGVVKEYSKVLNQREIESFFGEDEARRPTLPIEPERVKRHFISC
ncbi:MAG: hypothetical protein OXG54_00030 [Gammaproteobacteria bacterium]|nr:hypothetical protein [Gammaproteobacteria bacterium]